MIRIAAIGLVLALGGCAPTLSQSNELGGRIDQTGSAGNDRAFALAEAHCAKYGKVAVVTERDRLAAHTLFECRTK